MAIAPTEATLTAGAFGFTEGLVLNVKRIDITATPTGSEQDTAFDLPAHAIVTDVMVYVSTAEATGGTKTLDIGILSSESGGDADGLVDGISVAATGWVRPGVTLTVGGTETYISAITRGVLFAPSALAGSNTAGDVGTYFERPFLSSSVTGKSISYTAGSNDFAEFRGAIYIWYWTLGS